ncbi:MULTISPECIES: dihydroorotase [Acinetobacter calcoaceticus/baumannii complex]|uniref:dihydroorotase n=1 Tax=Acinetobacter TaxID=469 RepID=UPI00034C7163|nr:MULTISPECIES: dihydroorotase [Acinetobacter calcoaceticus/baumannii complex]MCR0008591.1 dihydroorotase [Acinetobacter baumannii]MCV2392564.1 dihydroorotase [Acinetobacter baumannii]MDC4749088.1 dihydroorotase [Acinetobacter baumannii]MDC4998572.1 dihydroorotase [Acinetobacter baumannii]MDC5148665.1 dihydroorotase [Acinetobacter baumannii]
MNFRQLPDLIIRNANIVNEGQQQICDVLIQQGRMSKIQPSITGVYNAKSIEADGAWLLPGMIDDQVHFRDPGSPQKGSFASESLAAAIGGITSFMDMPNTNPPTLDLAALHYKKGIAAQHSIVNYAFHFGVSAQNLEIVEALDPKLVTGVKVFMGASTGNMLVDDPKVLERLFANVPTILLTHCESTPRIKQLEAFYREKYDEDIPAYLHPKIRDKQACFESSQMAVSLADKFGTQLHVLHLTTAKELCLFKNLPLDKKHITAEVCIHHLTFDESDYADLGHLIKCNPAIKTVSDKHALIEAVANSERLDIIGTDHAPHTWQEKQQTYFNAPSGLPLVQHALPALLELVADQKLSIETLVRKTSHQVADLFRIKDRGYIREGYWADLVLIRENQQKQSVAEQTNYMRCGWTPFQNKTFHHLVDTTIISGQLAWHQQQPYLNCQGQALEIDR